MGHILAKSDGALRHGSEGGVLNVMDLASRGVVTTMGPQNSV